MLFVFRISRPEYTENYGLLQSKKGPKRWCCLSRNGGFLPLLFGAAVLLLFIVPADVCFAKPMFARRYEGLLGEGENQTEKG